MGFLSSLLDKCSCHHDWEVHSKNKHECIDGDGFCRLWTKEILICKKCGKIKDIEL